MDHDEISWQDVLFEGVEVLITAAAHGVSGLMVRLAGRSGEGVCPSCGRASARVHDRYERHLQDLPLAGHAVRILLSVRRFVCAGPACSQRTFAEQISGLPSPYARCTDRLGELLDRVALALAGRAGSRMATALGLTAGRMGLLNRVRAMPDPLYDTPRVLGVDDFATRRGVRYATVITDGETHQVIDVLPGREAGPLADWLTAHPGVEVICRDRAGAYAEGSRLGAPEAVQVADRFHLWQGLGRAVEKTVGAHRSCLQEPAPAPIPADGTEPAVAADPTGPRAERKRAAHAQVHELIAQGHSLRAIARHLGWGRKTVMRYAHAARWQDMIVGMPLRPSKLDPYKPYLQRRWSQGCTNAIALHREITGQGYPDGYASVRDYLAAFRRKAGTPAPAPPSVRRVTGWLTRHPTTLSEEEHQYLKSILARCPELEAAHQHIRDFGEILTCRLGALLPDWIDAVVRDGLPGLTGYARSMNSDFDAVTAGLTLSWSSGGTEGAVNRIKKVKRQLYGRAEFELLRKLILLQ
ncbi:ISL3 family transposase [Streptomyces sp. NBC_00285]|uniref:ISL3 family transposase n=1 Tax=Streptomyces sp. NBC_00285 TaxID=2975700 RepID=UPI002E2CE551|nr:ISL3 family transposase [Streptomyces sp. NBC_00285]